MTGGAQQVRERLAEPDRPSSSVQASRLPVVVWCALIACAPATERDRAVDNAGCFVLPGVWAQRTQSYRVAADGRIEVRSEASAPGFHMRAAVHPDGDILFVNAVGDEESGFSGVALHVFDFDSTSCTLGALRQTVGAGGEDPSNERAYGLAVHPNGRWIYQTTASLGEIRVFETESDRSIRIARPHAVPSSEGAPCLQVRRLLLSPDGRTLYSNCNNADAGADFVLHTWRVRDDGGLTLLQTLPLEGMDAGVFDPVLHPSGEWLYQPMSGNDPRLEAGPGAYVLTYRVGEEGELDYDGRVPIRTITPADDIADPETKLVYPVTLSLSPDGRKGYVAVHASLPTMTGIHELVEVDLEDSGAGFTVSARRPAAVSWEYSSHHGGTVVQSPSGPYYVSYLTDYDTLRGGILQTLRIDAEGHLEFLDPPYLPTGLPDARQPIAVDPR